MQTINFCLDYFNKVNHHKFGKPLGYWVQQFFQIGESDTPQICFGQFWNFRNVEQPLKATFKDNSQKNGIVVTVTTNRGKTTPKILHCAYTDKK